MADVWKFVDSPTIAATVRLDLNDDDGPFHVQPVEWGTARLRRAVSQNLMTNGGYVGPSTYDLRVLPLSLDVISSTQDDGATALQALNRELDRETNWLMYQPVDATFPVFFKVYRSDKSRLLDVLSAISFRQVTVDLLVEPFAYGTLESFSGTISQDGTSGSSFIATTPTIKGDVAAPFAVDLDGTGIYSASPVLVSSIASESAPSLARLTDNADFTLGTAASNVTGAGSGFWNGDYVNVSFGTTTADANRASFSASLPAGRWRVLANVVNYDASPVDTDHISAHVRQTTSGGTTLETGATVKLYESSGGVLLYSMGVFTVPFGGAPSSSNTTAYFRLHAAQRSSTGALRIDGVVFVPVESDDFTDQTSALLTYTSPSPTTGLVVDGLTKGTYYGDYGSGYPISPPPMLGGFGRLSPGQVNSLVIGTGISTVSYAVYYYPLYDIAKPPGS